MSETTLVLAAHPDDEVLGCGGYIQQLRAKGERVIVSFLADGISSRPNLTAPELGAAIDLRRAAMMSAGTLLDYEWDQLPVSVKDNGGDAVPRLLIARAIEAALAAFHPHRLLIHSAADMNIDHRRLAEAALIAARPIPGQTVTEILAFEVASSTEWGFLPFTPSLYVDISEALEVKLQALGMYREEVRPFPHPRSIIAARARAMIRGSEVGVDAAEAFEVIRMVR